MISSPGIVTTPVVKLQVWTKIFRKPSVKELPVMTVSCEASTYISILGKPQAPMYVSCQKSWMPVHFQGALPYKITLLYYQYNELKSKPELPVLTVSCAAVAVLCPCCVAGGAATLGGKRLASSMSSSSTRCLWNRELGSSFLCFFSFCPLLSKQFYSVLQCNSRLRITTSSIT